MSEHGTHILVLGCASGKSEREKGDQSRMIFHVKDLRGHIHFDENCSSGK